MFIREVIYLFLGHFVNIVVPIILMPMLAYRLGPKAFGEFVVITGATQYFAYIMELGLNNIAISKLNSLSHDEKIEMITSIFILKLILFIIIGSIAYTIFFYLLIKWGWNSIYAIESMLPLITCIIYPAWFFIAEKKQIINLIVQSASKIIIIIGIITLIHNPKDAPIAVAIYMLSVILVSFPFIIYWLRYIDVRAGLRFKNILQLFKDGVKVGGLAVRDAWSANGIAPIIGVLLHGQQFGEFAMAEKLVRAITLPSSTLGTIVLANYKSIDNKINKFIPYKIPILIITLFLYVIIMYLFSEIIGSELPKYLNIKSYFITLSLIIPFVYINYIFINLYFIGYKKYFMLTKIIAVQIIIMILFAFPFAKNNHWNYVALVLIAGEVIMFVFFIRLKNIKNILHSFYQK